MLFGGINVLYRVHSRDLDVAAEGQERLDAVFGLAPSKGPQPGPEAGKEFRHLHAECFGRTEVGSLMKKYGGKQPDDDGNSSGHMNSLLRTKLVVGSR